MIFVPNFSFLGWFSFLSAVNCCHQLSTAVDSWWQLSQKKFKWNFHPHPKSDMCAKIQLSRLIFFYQLSTAVISCQQLLTADDSCQVKNLNVISICTLKVTCVPNSSSLGWFLLSSDDNSRWQPITTVNNKTVMEFSSIPQRWYVF